MKNALARKALGSLLINLPLILTAGEFSPEEQKQIFQAYSTNGIEEACSNWMKIQEKKFTPRSVKWMNKHPQYKRAILTSIYPLPDRVAANLDHLLNDLPQWADKYPALFTAVAISCENHRSSTRPTLFESLSPKAKEVAKGLEQYYNKEKPDWDKFMVGLEKTLTDLGLNNNRGAVEPAIQYLGHKNNAFPPPSSSALSEYIAFLIDLNENPKYKALKDELFDIKNTPWPILLPLGKKMNIKVAHWMLQKRLNNDNDFKSKYTKEYKKLHVAYKKSQWFRHSVPRIIEDGGVCGRKANLAIAKNLLIGSPTTTMGQPGHCAVFRYGYDKGDYIPMMRRSIASMDNSRATWFLGLSPLSTVKRGVELNFGLCFAMKDVKSFEYSRLAVHMAGLDSFKTARQKVALQAVNLCPFNTEASYILADQTDNAGKIKLIKKLRQYGGNGPIAQEHIGRADQDVDDNSGMTTTLSGAKKRWMLLVTNQIVQKLNTDASNAPGIVNFLKQEVQYHLKNKDSRYLAPSQLMLEKANIATLGLAKTEKLLSTLIQKVSNQNCREFNAKVTAVCQSLSRKDSIQLIRKLKNSYTKRKDFSPTMLLKRKKRKNIIIADPVYANLIDQEVLLLKKSGKKGKREAADLSANLKATVAAAKEKK